MQLCGRKLLSGTNVRFLAPICNAGIQSRIMNITTDQHSSGTQTSFLERTFNPGSGLNFRNDYLRLSKTLTYSYLFALPLVILYEIGIFFVNAGSPTGVRIGADVMLKRVLGFIGMDSTLWFAGLLVLFGIGIVLYERRNNLQLIPKYFAGMFAESAVYALVIGTAVGMFVGGLFGMTLLPDLQDTTGPGSSLFSGLVLSLGAGVYEELIFRVVLVTGLYALLRLAKLDDRVRYGIAAIVGALIFSAVHYTGSLGDPFEFSSFTFRFLMGLALNSIFLLRGFGIAAMTHALYDIYVTLM